MRQESSLEVEVSILIVNYNGKEFLGPCLNSIHEHVTISYEIILVDNASSDDSAEYVSRTFYNVNLIQSNVNLGFAAGNNIAARSAKGKYLLLLNYDTLLQTDLKKAISLLSSNLSIGVIGCRMHGPSNEYRYSTGHFPNPLRLFSFSTIFNREGMFKLGNFPENTDSIFDVDWVEGSFLLTRKGLWQKLGGMDEGYFMYVEDVDYCKRVRDAGFKVVYYPSLSFLHYGGYTNNRLGLLIKGFRRYHRKFSTSFVNFVAQFVLTFGMILKVVVYSLSSMVRCQGLGKKSLDCWKGLKESLW